MISLNHGTLVDSMRKPTFYPHPVEAVEFIQTHISSLFLTGTLAYKLKKPMDFGFLDFTTVDLRRKYCQKEVELNRRLAPSVYLGVDAITQDAGVPELNGTGPIVDWVVVMRQLDGRLLGSRVLERGELDGAKIDAVVDALIPFYETARTGPDVDQYGTLGTVRFNTDENFEQTAGFVGSALSSSGFEQIRSYTDGFCRRKEGLFQRRVAEGWIRECHGDLHLGNIFFEEPPVIFDCIEFNERFRCSDVAVDLAFLVMDLDFRGKPDLGSRVVRRYVEGSGDGGFLELVDFYCCYRAYVRGKIACFTSADAALDQAARAQQLELARRYFNLSHRYATEGGHGLDCL